MKPDLTRTTTRDPDLTSGELFVAQDADTLVVERCPMPKLICRPQNQQAISHWDVGI
jgi:hypothetical protein